MFQVLASTANQLLGLSLSLRDLSQGHGQSGSSQRLYEGCVLSVEGADGFDDRGICFLGVSRKLLNSVGREPLSLIWRHLRGACTHEAGKPSAGENLRESAWANGRQQVIDHSGFLIAS